MRTRRPPSALHEANVVLTERLVRAASAGGVRLVLVSSSSVYGNATELPTPEHAPLAPLNPYAASKVAAEDVVQEHGMDAVIVRPFSVYGPGQRPEMAFARWIDCLAHSAAAAVARVARNRARLHLRRRRCRGHPRRAAPRPRRRGVQPVRLAVRGPALSPRATGGGVRPAVPRWRPPRAPPPRLASRRGAGARRPRSSATSRMTDLATGLRHQLAAASPRRLAA